MSTMLISFNGRENYQLLSEKPKNEVQQFSEEWETQYHPRNYIHTFKSFLFALLPSWIQCFYIRPQISNNSVQNQLHSNNIAWLDGLRGIAALIVSLFHYAQLRFEYLSNPFFLGPYTEEDGSAADWTNPLQLPIIRLAFSGGSMVPIFFVISGYVLSISKVTSIRNGRWEKLSEQLFSSSVRRGFRLFPAVVITLAVIQAENHFHFFLEERTPNVTTFVRQIFDRMVLVSATIFKIDHRVEQLWQFWTIPIEFTDSIILFAVATGISRMTTKWRIGSVISMALFALFNGCWGVFLFLIGWTIAEVETIWQSDERQSSTGSYLFWVPIFITGLVVAGFPGQNVDHDPLLRWMLSATPQVYTDQKYFGAWMFWTSLAAPMVVWPIFRIPRLQSLFTTRFTTYLGQISYALYAVHFQVYFLNQWIASLSNVLFGLPSTGMINRTLAAVFELIIFEVIVFWQADLFWRYVDMPTVKFAKFFEKTVRGSSWN